jgi:hypothetical protein
MVPMGLLLGWYLWDSYSDGTYGTPTRMVPMGLLLGWYLWDSYSDGTYGDRPGGFGGAGCFKGEGRGREEVMVWDPLR